ncbi:MULTISPECIES: hypothetical protein [Kordiimonas]|jgi:hypothetical protein|uniref:hypothetical protein n=1 Tax=Kordiimonas TaxID=288021 RepID=UPI00257C2D41|nr:hypothetical protein [Kordiimonas sp. UBA4487]
MDLRWVFVVALAALSMPSLAIDQLYLSLTVDASEASLVVENRSDSVVKIGKNQFDGVPSVFSIRMKGPAGELISQNGQSPDGWFNPAVVVSQFERFPLSSLTLEAGETLTYSSKVASLLLPARSQPGGGGTCIFQIRAVVVFPEQAMEPETIKSDWVEADCAALFPAR